MLRPLPTPDPCRRSLALACTLWPLGVRATPDASSASRCRQWPLWAAFAERFIQADGRVIDDQHATRYTTSEGQAYSLFFCLVANERERFDILLRWTERHLAAGNLRARLPGWRWGRHDNGMWSLVDANPAADADLWLTYTLFEAARLWNASAYRDLAQSLLQRIEATEVVRLPGLGAMLLPAPQGFQTGPARWRVNPSYLPIHQLRFFAGLRSAGPWADIADSTVAMLRAVASRGFVPDWVEYSASQGWHATALSPAEGSYDAIRVYLWAGLLHPQDPVRHSLLRVLRGMRDWLVAARREPPQRIRTDTGAGSGVGPPGFSGALLPYLKAVGPEILLKQQAARIKASSMAHADKVLAPGCNRSRFATALVGAPPSYYDQMLTLFGQGALEGRYRFGLRGELRPAWHRTPP